MFMPENSFDDDGRKGRGIDLAKDVDDRLSVGDKPRSNTRELHPNMLDDDDIEEIGGPAGSRSNVIQQQRDLHKKKMQERMNGGAVRSAGARQFSAPRPTDVDDKPSYEIHHATSISIAPPSREKDRSFSRQDANDSWVEPKKGSGRDSTRKDKGSARDRSSSPDLSSEEDGNDEGVVSMLDDKKAASAQKGTVKKGKLDLTDMKAFLLRPVPKAYDVVECYIERNRTGANKLFPEYCLYMKDGDRFLLTAKKRPNNRTSNYLISMQRGDLSRKGSENFLGKLRANFIGTEFVIYDNGLNPKGADQHTLTVNPATIRQELGIAVYAKNVLGHRGPRKMRVCVPRVREDGTRVVWRPTTKEDEMVNKCKEQDHTNLTYLINKPPRWNDQVGAYVLNFNGRVTMASVKNFQLVTPEDQETVILQFGRVGKELFTMDFRAPLCPFQAFAITLSSFDSKLACE
ncbi:hypothetical protein DYB28_003970 [Aphanomyces astaci]|uniref:Tubby C-terminal domain-containing protein n=1 Tax=Aphanomyces astaci TaxID=112090 RepID=A0A397AGC6_APHAT|nr:hypothetical protein DYB36_003027 [Aphanomyces astaci]RLO11944.1 hypothetical protein DYB28_003970 [Aphanomyces astaci]